MNERPNRELYALAIALRTNMAGCVTEACTQKQKDVDQDALKAIIEDLRQVDEEIAGHRTDEFHWKDLRRTLAGACRVFIKHLEAADARTEEGTETDAESSEGQGRALRH